MGIKKKTALLIDDDQDFCSLVRTILEAKGMEVKELSCISHAREFLQKEIPNIILLDINLLGENGTEFLKERARNSLWAKIPVIVCSSQNLAATVKTAIHYGADDYLLKPIKQTDLLQRIRKYLLKEINLAHYFEPDEIVEIIAEARTIATSDASFVSRADIGFAKGAVSEVHIPVNEKDPLVSHFISEEKSKYGHGHYDTVFTNAAVMEAEKNRILMLKTFWRSK